MYPINLILEAQPCTVVGGGSVALRKTRSLLEAGAAVTVISPVLTDELQQLCRTGRITWKQKSYEKGDAIGSILLICAAADRAANALAAADGKRWHILTNVADAPAEGSFTVPSSLRQGDLLITISTNGTSPELARWLRHHLEERLGPWYGPWLERLAPRRLEVRQLLPDSRARRDFWRTALTEELMHHIEQGNLDEAEEQLNHAISHIRPKS